MSADFKSSETKVNLMRAFAGESMARNRYVFHAKLAKKEHMYVLEYLFRFTADQELQHARIFYEHLRKQGIDNVVIDAGYPVDLDGNMEKLLKASQDHEYEEFDPIYQRFGNIAREEGFPEVASSFHMIAEIEKVHGDRFGEFAKLVEQDKLFVSQVETKWICLKCGFIYEGLQAPKKCAVCGGDRGLFMRLDLCPFHRAAEIPQKIG